MYAIFSFSSTGDKMDYLATNFHHLIPHVVPDVGNNIIAELRENWWREIKADFVCEKEPECVSWKMK